MNSLVTIRCRQHGPQRVSLRYENSAGTFEASRNPFAAGIQACKQSARRFLETLVFSPVRLVDHADQQTTGLKACRTKTKGTRNP